MSIPSWLPALRQKVYQKFRKRADAALDLVAAVTTAGIVTAPVALSEEPPFRRKFSRVYDVLEHGAVDVTELGKVLYASQPADCATLAGYEVYAVDATDHPRPEAATLPDRVLLKSAKDNPAGPGWKFSWLVAWCRAARPGSHPKPSRRSRWTAQPIRWPGTRWLLWISRVAGPRSPSWIVAASTTSSGPCAWRSKR